MANNRAAQPAAAPKTSVATGKQPAQQSNAAGKQPVPPKGTAAYSQQQMQMQQQAQTAKGTVPPQSAVAAGKQPAVAQHALPPQPARSTPSAVANGKARAQPAVLTKSAVPVVPSAPAKSVTGNTINNPPPPPAAPTTTGKRAAATAAAASQANTQPSTPSAASPAAPTHAQQSGGVAGNSLSSTASAEREKIRDFWLGLSESERRGLVKIEKDAVLKKMKEQQKHGCTCAVCGRKRTAIEVELEVLYDAYYDELEDYANHQQLYKNSGGSIPPPMGPGPFPGSVDVERIAAPPAASANTASNSKTAAPAKKAAPAPAKATPRNAQPPASAVKSAGTNAPASVKSKSDHHTHSPSCPHYPHTHDHPHHHHHHHKAADGAPASRGKQNAQPAAEDEEYSTSEEEEDCEYEDDDCDYDDEGVSASVRCVLNKAMTTDLSPSLIDYDGEDGETEEEDMPPLTSMDSGVEGNRPAHPPTSQHPPIARHNTPNHRPQSVANTPAKARPAANNPPTPANARPAPAAATQQQAQPAVAGKRSQQTNPGNDFFGFGSSLTVKGKRRHT